jgi:uncharacterized alkaline shock family protein YloU
MNLPTGENPTAATVPDPPGKTPGVAHPGPDAPQQVDASALAVLVARHACEVPGVAGLRPTWPDQLASLTTRRLWRAGGGREGVTVRVGEAGTCEVGVRIAVDLGRPIPQVARHLQRHLSRNLQAATGLSSVVGVDVVDLGEHAAGLRGDRSAVTAATGRP